MKDLYSFDINTLKDEKLWDSNILIQKNNQFYLIAKAKLNWFGKIIRWFKGESRLSKLHQVVTVEIESLLKSKSVEGKKKLESWKTILPSFENKVISLHNKRRWCKVKTFSFSILNINKFFQEPSKPVKFESQGYFPSKGEDLSSFRSRVYTTTKDAILNGYINSKGKLVILNHQALRQKTCIYQKLPPLNSIFRSFKTSFSVQKQDTYKTMLDLAAKGKSHIVGINMANLYHRGGGVELGASAQEEALCRSSNLIEGLNAVPYPLPILGGAYSPHVSIFRSSIDTGFKFMDEPVEVSMISLAAYDLRDGSHERDTLKLPSGPLSEDVLEKNETFSNDTKEKIRQMLRIAATKNHRTLVLGALGCGAFQNPPKLVAKFFAEVFNEKEFKGRFKQVIFAVLELTQKDKQNTAAFESICQGLNL